MKKKRRPSFVGSLSGNSGNSGLTQSTSVPSNDGMFLVPPNRDGSVSPSTSKKERSTSMIAGKQESTIGTQTVPPLLKGVSFEEPDKKSILKNFRKGSKGVIIGKPFCPSKLIFVFVIKTKGKLSKCYMENHEIHV